VAFWSQGCEASLLALRSLAELNDAWVDGGGQDLTMIGVHTPRFPYEDDSETVHLALDRYGIELPVLHDPDYLTWNRYNPGGWPAMVVVDKRGRVAGMGVGVGSAHQTTADDDTGIDLGKGVGVIDAIAEVVAQELARPFTPRRGDDQASADVEAPTDESDRPARRPGRRSSSGSTLSYPAGVAVTPAGKVVVADSGNGRLLVGTMDSDLRTLRPEVEITDLNRPTAVACTGESVIYVVESGTDSILQVDLNHGTLDLLADRLGGEVLAPRGLLVDHDGSVVVADAGREQLIRIAGGSDGDVIIGVVAGDGSSGTADGRAGAAQLAQPVGLTRTKAGIVFCDAASSNVRLLTDGGRVLTVTGNDYFDFGLVDGPAHQARLQRPSDVCTLPSGDVVVADTGNNRLRLLSERKVTTLGLGGLRQPMAVAAMPGGQLLVADTGNNRLVMADPARKTGWPVSVYPAAMTSVWEETEDGAELS
jgi:DNA-binding beta-propeller fold protein YncE